MNRGSKARGVGLGLIALAVALATPAEAAQNFTTRHGAAAATDRPSPPADAPAAADPAAAPAQPDHPAPVGVSGYGFWGNLELNRLLKMLQPDEEHPPTVDANFIEDAAVIILSKLQRDGYLEPLVTVRLTLADGSQLEHTWKSEFETLLPRPIEATRVQFIIRGGVLYFYSGLEFAGLQSIGHDQARSYFIEGGSLIPLKTLRIYTPSRLDRSRGNLAEALARLGYRDARVETARVDRDDGTGAVQVRVRVDEGLKYLARTVQVEVYGPDETEPRDVRVLEPAVPYSRLWEQDFVQTLLTEQYHQGYPDAWAEQSVINADTNAVIQTDRLVRVYTGPRVTIGQVRFRGAEHTRESLLRHKVRLEAGVELDRIRAERGRYRLARLGMFESVNLRYEETAPGVRDVIYDVDEGKQLEVSLLLGYGSYELLRGGLVVEQNNIFGLAHTARLRALQSFKATNVDYLYTMPELIGEDGKVFFDGSFLRRQELTFNREEYGASVGLQWRLRAIDTDASLRYSYEFLSALNTSAGTQTQSVTEAQVASIALDLKHDQRDNPLLPRKGYTVFSVIEIASAALGGDVDFQRIELGASVHHELTDTLILHLGLRHGIGLTLNADRSELPFNKRFFPGGENSVRGYQQGEAAPRDAAGDLIGAETFLQGNMELEQVLTPAWSLVVFGDGVGFSEDVGDYPFSETLASVGGGIRWKTVVGPVRLEYGYNLNPRPKDPVGTLHFSVGFPF